MAPSGALPALVWSKLDQPMPARVSPPDITSKKAWAEAHAKAHSRPVKAEAARAPLRSPRSKGSGGPDVDGGLRRKATASDSNIRPTSGWRLLHMAADNDGSLTASRRPLWKGLGGASLLRRENSAEKFSSPRAGPGGEASRGNYERMRQGRFETALTILGSLGRDSRSAAKGLVFT
jgi:hypothetical protein